MKTPTALDAMVRWLVLTLAGVVLFVLVPGGALPAPDSVKDLWWAVLHPVQWLAVAMMVLAWVVFVWHVVRLEPSWRTDGRSWWLLAGLAVCLFASGAGVLFAPMPAVWLVTAVSIALQVSFCVRVDAIRAGRLSVRRLRRRRPVTV